MKASTGRDSKGMTPSKEIEAILRDSDDWRGAMLSRLRAVIKKADPSVVEAVKWKKPSNPLGVPVWSHDGIVCVGNILKNSARLTFPYGARLKDPQKLFNAALGGNWMRGIDFHEGDEIDQKALTALIHEAIRYNSKSSRD
jgi:hypothetical protein